MLNLTELRRLREDYSPWPDGKSQIICGLCDLVEKREKRIAELEATLLRLISLQIKEADDASDK